MAQDEGFLSRWSRRKSEARVAPREELPPPPAAAAEPAPAEAPAPTAAAPLPPVDSLTPESDFAPFMAPEVDSGLRRQALKRLFSDPHFNAMDMLDVYVDDYSKPDPLPEGWLEKLEQLSHLGDRAGRDRAEAERRAARAEGEAQATQATEAPRPGVAASPPAPAAAPEAEASPEVRIPPQEERIPAPEGGESGA